MTNLELVVFMVAAVSGGVSVGAAVAASMYYRARRKELETKQRAQRRTSAIEQLEYWRDQEILLIEDDALEAAIFWEKADPENLEKLVHAIRTLIKEERIEPGGDNPLVLTIKPASAARDAKTHQPLPRGLQLTAGFG